VLYGVQIMMVNSIDMRLYSDAIRTGQSEIRCGGWNLINLFITRSVSGGGNWEDFDPVDLWSGR